MTAAGRAGFAGSFVGRDRDLAAVVSAVTAPPTVVVIEGEAGIGKTRLVEEVRADPGMAGRRCLVGSCRAITDPFPLGPVLEAVRGLGEHVDPASLSPVVGALRPLLPELAAVLPPRPEPLPGSAAERHRVFRALLDLLASLGPVTVVLEDLHWADELTVDLLRYLIGDLPPALSLIVTLRAEDAGPDVRALTARLPPDRRAHVALRPLDAAQTGDLAASLLATDRISADFAAYLCDRTGGLPFAVEEVTALLRDRGVVGTADRTWTRTALDELAVPVAVRDHVLERARLLPAAARALVDIVAVWQSPVPASLVAQVAGESPDTVAARLSEAIRAGLLVDVDGGVDLRHALAGQAVYDGIPGPQRRELHHRAADALRYTSTEPTERLAFHLHQAGRIAEWRVVAEEAADRASDLGRHDDAARLLEAVLRHASVDRRAEAWLAVKLGRASRATRRVRHVEDLLARALERMPPDDLRGELEFLLGAMLDFHDVDRPRSRSLFAAASANSGDRPEIKAWALVALEIRNRPEVEYAERRRTLTDVLRLMPRIDDPDTRLNLLGKVTVLQVTRGDPRWRRTLASIDHRVGDEPSQPDEIAAYESVAQAACFGGHHRDAELLIGKARAANTTRDEQRETTSRAVEALVDFCRGRWERARTSVPTLLRGLEHHPRAMYKLYLVAGDLALAAGDLDQTERWYETLATKADGGDGADLIPMLVASQIRLAHARGDHAEALEVAERHLAVLETQMLWPATYRCVPWLASALATGGHTDQAAAIGPQLAERLAGRDTPLASAALAFTDGFARAGAGDMPGAAAAFLDAARRYARVGTPFDAALARESAASATAQCGHVDAAGELLRAAAETYERLGADRDRARAARLTRGLGLPVPARHRRGPKGYGNDLTPREREVAELAAAGNTNRDIAARLFVSAETVKKHMQSVMRKLDVRSRAALGRRLPPRPPE